ncbi:MAG TPA: sporulation protein YunB [Firmicutes bacterium]|nr:sporulation protein YunB [Bacillota bacterium]
MRLTGRRRRPVLSIAIKKPSVKLLCFLALVAIGFYYADVRLRPTLKGMAEARARVVATNSINRAIREQVVANIHYEDLIFVKVDNRGRVVLMQPNTGEINRLASDATITVQELLKQISREKIGIPLGQLFGAQLLAGLGPDLPVRIVPVGTVESRVFDLFEEAGINQTRHKIYLEVKTKVRVLVPLLLSNVEVKVEVPLTEAVIMGEVPQVYFGGRPLFSLPYFNSGQPEPVE